MDGELKDADKQEVRQFHVNCFPTGYYIEVENENLCGSGIFSYLH